MSGVAFLINDPSEIAAGVVTTVKAPPTIARVHKTAARRFVSVFAIACIALAPLPAGGNHPLAWMFWATAIGLIGCFAAQRSAFSERYIPRACRHILHLGFAFVVFTLFQALPISGLSGDLIVSLPNISIATRHLSIAPGATFLAAVRVLGYLVFFALVLFSARNPYHAKTLGLAIFAVVSAHALLAITLLHFLGDSGVFMPKTAFLGAATGTFINKNSFATFLGIGLVLGLSLILSDIARRGATRRLELILGVLGLGIVCCALIMTQSRLGIGATLAASILVISKSVTRQYVKPILIGAGGLAIAILTPVLAQQGFFDLRVSAQTRIDLYRQITDMIAARPLVGYGLDSFALAFEPFHAPPVTADFVWDKGHSTYLTLWAEAGIIFGSLPPLAGALAAKALWRKSRHPRRGRSMALAGLAALLLVALHSLADFSLEIQANQFLLIAVLALGLAGGADKKEMADGR